MVEGVVVVVVRWDEQREFGRHCVTGFGIWACTVSHFHTPSHLSRCDGRNRSSTNKLRSSIDTRSVQSKRDIFQTIQRRYVHVNHTEGSDYNRRRHIRFS